jgi:hypothetical protein
MQAAIGAWLQLITPLSDDWETQQNLLSQTAICSPGM